jgi:hypothetical protein
MYVRIYAVLKTSLGDFSWNPIESVSPSPSTVDRWSVFILTATRVKGTWYRSPQASPGDLLRP